MSPRFLWVTRQLDSIGTLRTDADRRKALDHLPLGMTATYTQMFERIVKCPKDLKIATRALTWLLLGERPLTLRELAIAVVIDPDTEFEDDQRLDSEEVLLEICRSFLKLNPQTQIVEINHLSIRDYLMSPILPDGSRNCYYVNCEKGNAFMLRVCLTYISSPLIVERLRRWGIWATNTSSDMLPEIAEDKFLLYSAFRWFKHGAKADWDDVRVSNCILEFLNGDSMAFRTWSYLFQMYCEQEPIHLNGASARRMIHKLSRDLKMPTGLYYSSLFGFSQSLEISIQEGQDVNQLSGYTGSPLVAAILNNHDQAVKILLDQVSAGVDLTGVRDALAFPSALDLDGAEDVKILNIGMLLLDHGADVDEVLWQAVDEIFNWLAASNSQWWNGTDDYDDRNELAKVGRAFWWHLGWNINVQNSRGSTALHLATASNRKTSNQLVMRLLNKGADPNISDDWGFTPLHYAVEKKDKDLVQMIIRAGVDVNLAMRFGYTALHRAAQVKNCGSHSLITPTNLEIPINKRLFRYYWMRGQLLIKKTTKAGRRYIGSPCLEKAYALRPLYRYC
jgi:hypothetical protein